MDEDITNKKSVRWEYLSSVVTALLALTLCVLLVGGSLGLLSLGAIPQGWFVLYASALAAAIGWLFGREYIEFRDR